MKNDRDKITRIVIWGLKHKYHTHRHIHQAFYKNAKKLGYDTLWLEDWKINQKKIKAGDLIISAEVQGKMIKEKFKFEEYNLPVRDDVKYCLHNFKEVFKSKLKKENYINLAVYTKDSERSDIKISTARYFDTKTRTLYQPWGTDLLPEEFKDPVYNRNNFVFWIGSVWNNKLNQGNIREINELKKTFSAVGINFINLRFVPNILNILLIRKSRLAPAIAGQYQVDINYLPCRMFKNISYGQLGITNVKKFNDILNDSFIKSDNIKDLIEKSLNLSEYQYIDIIKRQQDYIKKYTYKESIHNIINLI